jgi:hypothetical protein
MDEKQTCHLCGEEIRVGEDSREKTFYGFRVWVHNATNVPECQEDVAGGCLRSIIKRVKDLEYRVRMEVADG